MYATQTTRALLLLALATAAACAQDARRTAGPSAEKSASGIQWGPAPAIFPPGAQLAVLQGDPSKPELYTVRLRMPSGYRIPPHTHPTDEHVTVIEGRFSVGMGEQFVTDQMTALGTGGFVTAPANHAHYAMARGITVVQVHGVGPFQLTYVNPADIPVAARR